MIRTFRKNKVYIGFLAAASITPIALTDPASRIGEVELVVLAAWDCDRADVFACPHGSGLDLFNQQ